MLVMMKLTCTLIVIFWVLASNPCKANTDKYTVSIRQFQANRGPYTKICEDTAKLCHLFLGIDPQNTDAQDDLELDVSLLFRGGGVYLQFKSGWDYFSLPDQKEYAYMSLPETRTTEKIKIFAPDPSSEHDPKEGLLRLPVVRPPPRMIAELEITVQRQ